MVRIGNSVGKWKVRGREKKGLNISFILSTNQRRANYVRRPQTSYKSGHNSHVLGFQRSFAFSFAVGGEFDPSLASKDYD